MVAKNDGAEANFGLNRLGTMSSTQAGLLGGASPVPFMAVAADTPIIVATGGPKPIRLGDKVPYNPATDTTLHVWNWQKSSESRTIKLAKPPGGMALTPDGKSLITRDGRLIDLTEGDVRQLDNMAGDVYGMLFAHDGRRLLLTVRQADMTAIARMLDFPSGKNRCETAGQWWYTFAGAFSPDGNAFFLMDKDRFIGRHDATSGKQLDRYEPAFTNSIRAIAVSADGKRVAACAAAPIDTLLWETAGGKLLHRLPPTQKQAVYSEIGISALAFSPDGKLLAGAGAYSLVLWDTTDGKVVRLLPRTSGNASELRFSLDGKTLTSIHGFYGTGGRGENVLIYPAVHEWDVATGEERKQ
jgi:WD40 repeat protein